MPKLIFFAILVAAAVTIGMRVLSSRDAGMLDVQFDNEPLGPGEVLSGSVRINPDQELVGATLSVDLVARRRFSSPTETADAAADFYHDTSDLFRSNLLRVTSVSLQAGKEWLMEFTTTFPEDSPSESDRLTNTPNLGGQTSGTKPWTVEWVIEAQLKGKGFQTTGQFLVETK